MGEHGKIETCLAMPTDQASASGADRREGTGEVRGDSEGGSRDSGK